MSEKSSRCALRHTRRSRRPRGDGGCRLRRATGQSRYAPGAQPDAALIEDWSENSSSSFVDVGDIEAIATRASIKVEREFRTARQCMAPIEGRGVVAEWDTRLEQLILHSATQMPHIVRSGLAECLNLDHGRIRVIAPDVGGGFGYKGILLTEEVALAWLTRRLGRPVRWIEDRREHLTANANCREQFTITAYADADGEALGLKLRHTLIPVPIRLIHSPPALNPHKWAAFCQDRTISKPSVAGLGHPAQIRHLSCHTAGLPELVFVSHWNLCSTQSPVKPAATLMTSGFQTSHRPMQCHSIILQLNISIVAIIQPV